jgi:tetratricopeptide (TPR) repeat protein
MKNVGILFVLLLITAIGCRKSLPEGKIPTTLILAWDKTELVSGDDEARNVLKIRLVRQTGDFHDYQTAMKEAQGIGGVQRGLALAMLAWDAANSGYMSQAKQFISLADADTWIVSDSDKGERNAYLAGAEMRLGQQAQACKRMNSILDTKQKGFASSLIQTAQFARNPHESIPEKEKIRQDAISPTVLALLYHFKNPATTHTEKVNVFRLIEGLIPSADPGTATVCWSRLAVAAYESGLVGEGSVAARKSMELAQAIDPRTEGYAVALKHAALALLVTGDRAEALRCLELASAKPELIAFFFQPEAMMAIAEGYEKAGEKEKANAFCLRAIKTAKSHPHPRARQINVVLILSYMANAGVSPSPEVMEVIDAIGRGEGGDAPLPPGYVRVGDAKTNAVTAPAKQDKKDKKDKKKKESKVPAA